MFVTARLPEPLMIPDRVEWTPFASRVVPADRITPLLARTTPGSRSRFPPCTAIDQVPRACYRPPH